MKSVLTALILFFAQTAFAQSELITLPHIEVMQLIDKATECYKKVTRSSNFIDEGPYVTATKGKKIDGKMYEISIASKVPYFPGETLSSITFHIWSTDKKAGYYPRTTIAFVYKSAYNEGTLMYQTTQSLNGKITYEKDEAKVRKSFYDLLQRFDQLL